MGTVYFIACEKCKVIRDIGKHMDWIEDTVEDRHDAISYSYNIKDRSFQIGLALSFLLLHNGHACKIVNDCCDLSEYKYDLDFYE